MTLFSPTDFTLAFLRQILPEGGGHIIEVGCGDGELASNLLADGYRVTALDHDQDAVNTAQSKGVQAICADWSSWQPQLADVVIFTRSLHHLENVEAALQIAIDSLGRGGMIIAEDFAYSDTSEATVSWLKNEAQQIQIELGRPPDPGSFVEIILQADNPLTAWYEDHHHIHSAAVMEAAFGRIDPLFESIPCPYLFRYLVSAFKLPSGKRCASLLDVEQRAIESSEILPIGRRYVANA